MEMAIQSKSTIKSLLLSAELINIRNLYIFCETSENITLPIDSIEPLCKLWQYYTTHFLQKLLILQKFRWRHVKKVFFFRNQCKLKKI